MIAQYIQSIYRSLVANAHNEEYEMIPIGILAFFCFPVFYFLWLYSNQNSYENLTLRLVAVLLAIPLILKNYWPLKCQRLLPLYWYGTLLYIIPFFFTFMFLKNNGNVIWQVNIIIVTVLLVLLVEWQLVFSLSIVGISMALLVYILATPSPQMPQNYLVSIVSVLSLVMFSMFLYKKSKIQKERLDAMQLVGTSIAHELRTPLRSISNGAETILEYFPELLKGYELAKNAGLPVEEIYNKNFKLLEAIPQHLLRDAASANMIIDMLLMNITGQDLNGTFTDLSASRCITDTLQRYPFQARQKPWVDWDKNKNTDFVFHGNKLLFSHILFNLIKNSLYYIDAANKDNQGKIFIQIKQDDKANRIYFKDNGIGISKKILPKIFDNFFTQTIHGAGIGLSFSKMAMEKMGGTIECQSMEGKFTEFILSFPK